jgi:hypothetical protein
MDKELSKNAKNASSANLTAVDFLIEEIKADALVCVKSIDEWNQVFKKAKEMEKQQIIDAFNNGEFFALDYYHPNSSSVDGSETYYNETYGGNDGKN